MCGSNRKSLQPAIQASVLPGERFQLSAVTLAVHPDAGKSWSVQEAIISIQMRLDMGISQTAITEQRRCIQAPAVTWSGTKLQFFSVLIFKVNKMYT